MQATRKLSAVVVVGDVRNRAQRVLDRLYVQTAADDIEIIVVDTAGAHDSLAIKPDRVATQYLSVAAATPWGEARAIGIRAANSPIVAFTEDHSIPAHDWAESILRASHLPWIAAGYAFRNANPGEGLSWRGYISWGSFMADYGEWADPLPNRPVGRLPCNNVAYRRDALLKIGDALGAKLHSDITLQEYFAARGEQFAMIRDAFVSHQNHEFLRTVLSANFVHCRVIAASRVREGKWRWPRRLAYAIAVPLLVPFMKLGWLLRIQLQRRQFWGRMIAGAPVIASVFVWSAIGEGLGYLFGFGNSIERFRAAEVSIPRTGQDFVEHA
jgi:glycosyltransferase involved in cell wall biosynthesis